jgi:hypothetical protein
MKDEAILTISVKHVPSAASQPCAACTVVFVPSEDSGSRVLTVKAPEQATFGALLCGGCYSKWSHGTAMTLRQNAARS